MSENKTKYTPAQQAVIESSGNNLLVSAGAGSGKTTVLVEKATTQIKNKEVKLDQLLIVTFTESASNEMKQRLYEKLSEHSADPVVAEELENINNSDICTLHSFCQKIIKQYFYELDIDPAFGIIDDNDSSYLKAQILQDILQQQSAEYDSNFERLTEIFYKGRKSNNLKDNILSFYEFLQTQDDRQIFLQNISKSCYNVDLKNNPAATLINKKVCLDCAYFLREFKSKLDIAQGLKLPKLESLLSSIVQGLSLINIENDFETNFDNAKTVFSLSGGFGYCKKEDEQLATECAELWETFGKAKNNIKELYCQDNVDLIVEHLAKASRVIDKFVELTLLFEKEYTYQKSAKKVLDFNDLEKYALKLLSNDTLRKALVGKYKFIYIDEYQDINNIQESILNKLTNGKNLIMVGDIKQSIYAFRNSSPQIFIDKKGSYELDNAKGTVIDLNENFRSNPLILKFINKIFDQVMTLDFGGVDYKNRGSFNGRAEYQKVNDLPEVSVNIINDHKEETEIVSGLYNIDQDIKQTTSSKQLEAHFVAQQISKLVGAHQIYDAKKKTTKTIEYKDITILCRTRNLLKDFANMLIKYNIPVSANLHESMFDNPDIMFLLSLLKVINNPNDDIELATVLSHHLLGFDYEELITIRQSTDQDNFYLACKEYLSRDNDLAKKLQDVFDYFKELRFESNFASIYNLLLMLDNKLGITNYFLSLPNGRDRQVVVNNYIESFSGSSYNYDLVGYINYVDTYLKDSVNATNIIQPADCVKLDTIHSSKGLEYNIVFLVGCGEGFVKLSTKQDLVKEKSLGLGINYYDLDSRAAYNTIAKKAINMQIEQSELLEETRLLYVALSRAKNHLYIVGKANVEKINTQPSEYSIRKANNYLEWILSGFDTNTLKAIKLGNKDFVSNPKTMPVVVRVFDRDDLVQSDIKNPIQAFDTSVVNKQLFDDIQTYLNKPYHNQLATTIAQKNSVTSLMAMQDNYESINNEPKVFDLSEHNSGVDFDFAKLGTAYHTVMQYVDFDIVSEDQVKTLINKLIANNVYLADYLNKVSCKKILQAVQQLKQFDLKNALREKQFMMYVPHNQVVPGSSLEDKVLLQGVIDLIVVGDRNIIIDYKTTRTDTAEQLVEKYQVQMDLYKKAAELALGKNIDQVYIYSFIHNKIVQVF